MNVFNFSRYVNACRLYTRSKAMEDSSEFLINQTIDFYVDDFISSFFNNTDDREETVHLDFRTILDNINDTADDTEAGYQIVFMAPNFILAMNVTLLMIGLLGNIIVCIVIFRGKSIYTATNYYLLNLSISDVSVLMTRAPFEIYMSYYRSEIQYKSEAMCFLHYLSFQTAVNVSTLTVTMFTVERYLVICHPFVAKSILETSLVKKIIIFTWLVALLFAFSPFILDGFNFDYWKTVYCTIDYDDKYALIFSTIFFFIPSVLIATMYILIGIKLKTISSSKQLGVRANRDTGKTIRLLALIVVGFVLCWAPFYAMEIISPQIFYMINDLVITGVNRPVLNPDQENQLYFGSHYKSYNLYDDVKEFSSCP
ncbi:motilin receptor-like [Phymastichus coffea]|uniref:motilin receptor-like n=1 Tax=Phymastichus coffea TaxID=108790 RepID=UPI00273C7876|nr:motilin receptor-like [Phymastichus coffea]